VGHQDSTIERHAMSAAHTEKKNTQWGWDIDNLVHTQGTRGVSHCGLTIYIKKYLKAKEEELWKLKYFTMQKYNLQKNL
jgi:hypothetical protein